MRLCFSPVGSGKVCDSTAACERRIQTAGPVMERAGGGTTRSSAVQLQSQLAPGFCFRLLRFSGFSLQSSGVFQKNGQRKVLRA